MVLFRHNLMRAEFLQSDTEEWNRQKSRDELGGGAGGGGVCLISFGQRFFFEFGCFLIFQSCLFCYGHNSLWFDGGGMDFDGEFHERNNHGLKIHFKKKMVVTFGLTPHFIALSHFDLLLLKPSYYKKQHSSSQFLLT